MVNNLENVGADRHPRPRKPRVRRPHMSSTAFVLSGGASLVAVQAGMLHALYERGVRPDLIVGSSGGAINGAFIASHPPTVESALELAAIWRQTRRGQVFPLRPLRGLIGFLGSSDHLVPGSGLRRLVESHVGQTRLEELPIPLHVVAVDVMTGEELLLSAGSTTDAVMASSAVPGVLPPVRWGNRLLIDGAVANNTPISQAVALGASEIYVLPTGHACALKTPPGSALGMSLHALSLLMHRQLIDDIARYRDHVKLVVLPPPCPLTVSPIDFSQADLLIEQALADARAFFAEGGITSGTIRTRIHQQLDPPMRATPRDRANG